MVSITQDGVEVGTPGSQYDFSQYWGGSAMDRAWPRSSDAETQYVRDGAGADARDLARTNPYGISALRTTLDSVVGSKFRLKLTPNADALGVDSQAAQSWADSVESAWDAFAESSDFAADAQRTQTFTGLMRTAFASVFTYGEAAGAVSWKPSMMGDSTCLHLVDPDRISDPNGIIDTIHNRRMGIERDSFGEPMAYHLRRAHISDSIWNPSDPYIWDRIERQTTWGRPRFLHYFNHDRADMTRGISSFTTASETIKNHELMVNSEIEAAALRATFAATLTSELDYESAINVIGPDLKAKMQEQGPMALALQQMIQRKSFYSGSNLKVGSSKVSHLLPGEKLELLSSNGSQSSMKDFDSITLYRLASALGVDYASLTKDYSDSNYSGARVALADIARSHEVKREMFVQSFAMPFVGAWLEERIVLGKTPMLGKKNFYEVKGSLLTGGFKTWSKIKLDPLKESQAEQGYLDMGAMSLKDVCDGLDKDWEEVLTQRAREKALMKSLGLTPEDINPTLIGQMAKATAPKSESGGTN